MTDRTPSNPSFRPGTPQLPKSTPPFIGVPAGMGPSGSSHLTCDPLGVRLDSPASSRRSSISGASNYTMALSQPGSRRSSVSGASIYTMAPSRLDSPASSISGASIYTMAPTRPGSPASNSSSIHLPQFKGASGKTLGELSNTLGELSSALVAFNKQHSATPASIATGVMGESLFGFGGVWQLVSALASLKREKNVADSLALLQGFANAISGTSGVISSIPKTPLPAGIVSQATWAIGEGANIIRQANQYWRVNSNWIDAEQTVCIAQFIASALKFTGIVAILSGGSSLWLVAEATGTLIAATSGIANLNRKGYFTSLNFSAIQQYLQRLGALRDIGRAPRTPNGFNPNAHNMV